jgi:hypothetical protein
MMKRDRRQIPYDVITLMPEKVMLANRNAAATRKSVHEEWALAQAHKQ